eukprot:SAG11_NODE_2524_length_3260_cov_1.524518_7_plen_40_part_01
MRFSTLHVFYLRTRIDGILLLVLTVLVVHLVVASGAAVTA